MDTLEEENLEKAATEEDVRRMLYHDMTDIQDRLKSQDVVRPQSRHASRLHRHCPQIGGVFRGVEGWSLLLL